MTERYFINDICDVGSSKRIYLSEYQESGIPFYRGKEIIEKDSNKEISNELFISHERYNEIKEKFGVPEKGDILMTAVGTIGISWYVDEDGFYFKDGNLIWFKNFKKDKVNSKYLYYIFKSKLFNEIIKNISIGSTQKAITIEQIKKIELEFPKIEIQNKIVKILDNINDKIKVNNEINNNLQELAKNAYYEKFKDKSNNGKLKDILELHRKSIKDKDESLKYFPVDVLPMNYLITKEGKPNEEAQSSLVEFKKYDILIGAMRVYFHRVCLAAEDGITRTTTFVLRPKNEDYLYYSLITLDKDEFIKYANDGSKGSTMPYAVWDNNCNEYEIYVPTPNEAKEFNDFVKPLFEIQIINEKNNRNLEKLRDSLLPRLMNGEIDLDNIEI